MDELLDARRRSTTRPGSDGLPAGLRVGMMVEVPAAALKIEAFLPHLDFVSIGTNDLTQYTLAAERGNAAVAALADALDPGVLRLIDDVCRAAGRVARSRCAASSPPTRSPCRCWSAWACASSASRRRRCRRSRRRSGSSAISTCFGQRDRRDPDLLQAAVAVVQVTDQASTRT